MVKLILGAKGSGKTKELIAAINESVNQENGSVVCIEKGDTLRYDINYRARLINLEDYCKGGLEFLKGFISGLHAGNFDISVVFIDSLKKLLGDDADKAEEFILWCDDFSQKHSVNFHINLSLEPSEAPESLKKYL